MPVEPNRLLHQFIEEAPTAMATFDREMRYLSVSRRWLEDYGLVGRDIHGLSHYEVFPENSDRWRQIHRRALSGEVLSSHEEEFERPDGRRQWLRWEVRPWRDSSGEIGGVVCFTQDVTRRKEAELALLESERYWRSTVDASPVAIVAIDEKGAILTFSKAAEKTFGHLESDVKGKNVRLLIPDPDHSSHDAHIDRYIKSREPRAIGRARVVRARRKDGETFPARIHLTEFVDGRRIFVGFIVDISKEFAAERRLNEIQLQLQHAGRLGAMGEMATSIAHEINQPLTAAASLAGAAVLHMNKSKDPACGEALPLLGEAISEIRRASEIIRQMRDFVKKRKTARSLHELNKVVEDACAIALLGLDHGGVEVSFRLGADVGAVNIDRVQIQQVIINLIRNALDAMKDAELKRLTVATAREDEKVEITIADSGIGVPAEMRTKIFQPFVSDKEEGLGVGLTITKSIIDAHQGEISVSDNNPSGAVFRVLLPAEGKR